MRLPFMAIITLCAAVAATQSYVNYESPQTRPIATSADGKRLFAVNTPDNRLAVYSLANPTLPVLLQEIPVGLEPISVVPRTRDEVWVVNFLSDSISVVSLSRGTVIDTIYVKDEPRDIAFAGSRAFVTVGTDREIRVFDVSTRQSVGTIAVFGDVPRALLASPDGKTIWATVHLSGNGTTIVPLDIAPAPPAPTNPNLPPAPSQGIIVLAKDPNWQSKLKVTLPDFDLVEIDTTTLATRRTYSGVGTVLFNSTMRPGTNEVWVANTEALNLTRFEPNLKGHVVDSRVTRITTGASARIDAFDLNPGLNYNVLPNSQALSTALSQPTDLVFSPDGTRLFVASFGTDRIGVLDAAGRVLSRIEVGNTPGASADPRRKRGPRGLAHHPSSPRLYVLNRLSNSISVVDTGAERVVREIPMIFDPTPRDVRESRGFLYDAKLSGNGTASCASCHIDGGFDGLAWDLGDRAGNMINVTNGGFNFTFHPMKGPMTTQTLRGLGGTEPFHWRGDRPDFQAFNKAFATLLGGQQLTNADRDDFARFGTAIDFPPNPHQNLDRTYPNTPAGESPRDGLNYFSTVKFDRRVRCIDCHSLPKGTSGRIIPRTFLGGSQDFKVPQLRNVYKRTGSKPSTQGRTSGFGLVHEGSVESVFELLGKRPFGQLARQSANKRMLQNFVEAFDTGTAPSVGYSWTVTALNADAPATVAAFQLLAGEAAKRNCDVVIRGVLDGRAVGFVYNVQAGAYDPDRSTASSMTAAQLRAASKSGRGELTVMGVAPGLGSRIGIDRDEDQVLDGDEGVEPYGAVSPACAAGLKLDANSPPTTGNDQFALVTSGADAGASGFLFFGLSATSAPVLDMTLYVSIAVILPMNVDDRGVGVVPFGIPNAPALRGQSVYFQSVVTDACSTSGLAASAGLKITVGS